MSETTILERRKIEAEFAGHLFKTLSAELGAARARELLGKAIIEMAHAAGRAMAAATPGNEKGDHPPTLEDYAKILPLWTRDDALAIQWVEQSPTTLAFNVTRCRYAESYKAMGLGDLGDVLSCNRDGEFCHGYNPEMKFTRTQTIMKGASHCDFRYTLEPKKEG